MRMRGRARWAAGTTTAVILAMVLVSAFITADTPPAGTRPLVSGGVIRDAGGLRTLPPEAVADPPSAQERAWLDAGLVPGNDPDHRAMAERALLDLRLLTGADGSVAASWVGIWKNMWPRDGSWVAAAFTETGHPDEALAVLRRLAELQRPNGTWEARYGLDGLVPDGRAAQQDAAGWVPWAIWLWYVRQDADAATTAAALDTLWPTVRAAADHTAASLTRSGLPPSGPDYWETRTDQVTIGTAGPLLTGLRASADLARRTGHGEEAERWASAADRLATGLHRWFGRYGYPRTPSPQSGADSAVAWLGPPFAAFDDGVDAAVRHADAMLTLPNGGVLPGVDWAGDPTAAWTPETASFALYDAAAGRTPQALERLDWLAAHRTPYGSLPEKVAADGTPASVAPLAWTGAAVLLALTALDGPMPTPPN